LEAEPAVPVPPLSPLSLEGDVEEFDDDLDPSPVVLSLEVGDSSVAGSTIAPDEGAQLAPTEAVSIQTQPAFMQPSYFVRVAEDPAMVDQLSEWIENWLQ
jgi:hypothetical protein